MAIKFLSISEFAHRIGVKPDTLRGYRLPPHDAEISNRRGWLPTTIDEWNARRPGMGARDSGDWNLPPEYRPTK